MPLTVQLAQKWRRRHVTASPQQKDLRDGRPEEIGSPCQRCERMTEEIQCMYGNQKASVRKLLALQNEFP